MKNEYFIDNINEETLVDITDKILNFEKNKKAKNTRKNLMKIISAAASIVLVIGIISIITYLPIFDVGTDGDGDPDENIYAATGNTTDTTESDTITATTSDDSEDFTDINNPTNENITAVEKFMVNVNPKSQSKWKGMTLDSGDGQKFNSNNDGFETLNNNNISYNINKKASTADGIEIYFPNGTTVKTHDSVKVDVNNNNTGTIKIAGDTIIDLESNITSEGSGKFTVINKDGSITDINGGNQQTYIGGDPDGDANKNYGESGLSGIIDLLPYMSQNAINEIARKEYERVGRLDKLNDVILYAMSESIINEFALKEIEENGFKNISDDVLVFMSEDALGELAKTESEKNGLKNIPDDVLAYMSNNALDELALKEYEKNGLKSISENVLGFMSKNAVDELAMKEYEKNGLESIKEIGSFTSTNFRLELSQKEFDRTGQDPKINTENIGRTINTNGNKIQSIIDKPFIGGTKYAEVKGNTITLGKDGEFAEISATGYGTDDAEVSVTVEDGGKNAVIKKDKDGVVSVMVENNGKVETTVINPDVKSDMTFELNGKTIEIMQSSKGGTAYVTITEGYNTAKIKIPSRAKVVVTQYIEGNSIEL